jgi:transposase-like protein
MPKTRPPYPPEFRRQMVELVLAGRGPEELAREFEPSAQAIAPGSSGPSVTMDGATAPTA